MNRKTIAAAAAASLFVSASGGAAELYKDYTVSKEVHNVTFVRVKPNKFDDYLDGLRQTWQSGCDVGKKLGTVKDCAIYVSNTMASRDFNVILVMTAPSAGATDPDEALYTKFMAETRAKLAQDKQDQLVEGYEEMRTFFGEQDFRRVTFK